MTDRLRVIDLGQGPRVGYATRLLAGYGADVIKVEPPGRGDTTRHAGPFRDDNEDVNLSGLALFLDAGKRSVCIDVDSPDGREILDELLQTADIVVDEMSADRADALGLGADMLDTRWPQLIRTAITPFGLDGPYKDFDAPLLILEALCGWLFLSGEPGRAPARIRGELASAIIPGVYAVIGSLAALNWRREHEEGQLVEISAQESMLACSRYYETTYAQRGIEIQRLGPLLSPVYGYKQAKDGWAAICAATGPQSATVAELAGMAEHKGSSLFKQIARREDEDALYQEFDAWCASQSRFDLFQLAQENRVPAGYVATAEDVLKLPQVLHRNGFENQPCGELGSLVFPGAPFRMSETEFTLNPAPRLGEHTKEILAGEVGLSDERLDALIQEQVIV